VITSQYRYHPYMIYSHLKPSEPYLGQTMTFSLHNRSESDELKRQILCHLDEAVPSNTYVRVGLLDKESGYLIMGRSLTLWRQRDI